MTIDITIVFLLICTEILNMDRKYNSSRAGKKAGAQNRKKYVMAVLTFVLLVSFVQLFIIQVLYVHNEYSKRDQQFNRLAKVALSRVASRLELDEMKYYFSKILEGDTHDFNETLVAPTGLDSSDDTRFNTYLSSEYTKEPVSRQTKAESLLNDNIGKRQEVCDSAYENKTPKNSSISPTTILNLQQTLKNKYLHKKEVLDEVILRFLFDEHNKKITEKLLNPKQLTNNIAKELDEVGLNTEFIYSVYDENGVLRYTESPTKYKNVEATSKNTIRQYIFCESSQNGQKEPYIEVTFPDKDTYFKSVTGFTIPVGITALIFLFIGLSALNVLYKQNKFLDSKTNFINNMTHELKTPVSSISLAGQMMCDDGILKNEETMQKLIRVINSECKRLTMLIEKVLQFSLFEERKIKLKFKELDAHELLLNVADVYYLKAELTGGSLELDLDAENTWINVDEIHMTNALFNLLENAVKYRQTDKPLMLALHTRNVGKKLEIVVEDNGIGIPKDSLTKIFRRFYRVSTGDKHDVKGFGLGLSYVQMVLHDMGGTIKAESQEGKGTRMIITLPNSEQI